MPNLAKRRLGSRGSMLLSTTLFALSGFFCVEAMALSGPWVALLCRFAIPLGAMGLIMRTRMGSVLRNPRPVHLLRAASLVGSQAMFLACASASSLFIAMVLYNTGPIFLVLIECVHRRRCPAWVPLMSCGVGFLGVWILNDCGASTAWQPWLFGLTSGLLYGMSQFTLHVASVEQSGSSVLLQTFFWCSAICLVPALLTAPQGTLEHLRESPRQIAMLLLAGLCSLGNQWLRARAYRAASRVADLAPLLYFGVVVALALQTLRGSAVPSSSQLAGTALVIAAALGVRAGTSGRKPASLLRNPPA